MRKSLAAAPQSRAGSLEWPWRSSPRSASLALGGARGQGVRELGKHARPSTTGIARFRRPASRLHTDRHRFAPPDRSGRCGCAELISSCLARTGPTDLAVVRGEYGRHLDWPRRLEPGLGQTPLRPLGFAAGLVLLPRRHRRGRSQRPSRIRQCGAGRYVYAYDWGTAANGYGWVPVAPTTAPISVGCA